MYDTDILPAPVFEELPSPHAHLWPANAPNPGTDWMDRAKCATTPPTAGRDPFDLTGQPNKARKALQACSWCPVMRECAQHTLHVGRDEGVVRAGTWIPSHSDGASQMPAVIARLERIAGIGQVAA